MPFNGVYNQIAADNRSQDEQTIPEYSATRFIYNFEEGVDSDPSMKNILFDSRTPATSTLITEEDFVGTYVSGVAPGWEVDVGVTASESTNSSGGPAQRVSNMSGFTQALRLTVEPSLTTGSVYRMEIEMKKVSGSGTLRVRFDGISSTSFDVTNASLPTDFKQFYFYGIATAATTSIEFTSDDTSLVADFAVITLVEVGGGNHMVMDHNLYSRSGRGVNYYDFDGSTQYFRLTEVRQSGLDLSSTWSCSAVVKLEANTSSIITSKWNPVGGQRGWQSFRLLHSTRALQAFWSSDGSANSSQLSASNILPATVPWASFMCVGMSFNAGAVTFFLNGAQQTNGAAAGTGTSVYDNTEQVAMGMVKNALGNPDTFMNGKIGKQIIWNGAALSAAQHVQVLQALRPGYGF